MQRPSVDPTVQQLMVRAGALLQQNRFEDSIDAYRTVLDRAPQHVDAWYNRAWLETRVRRFDDALASYAAALANGVAGAADVHVNRAAILSEHLGRDAEAEAELAAAIATSPDFLPAWLNLGLLHEDHADRGGARHAYERAIAIDPFNGRAHARLAALDIVEGAADEAIARLQSALQTRGLHAEAEAEMQFALGNALDSLGDHATAYSAIATANRTALAAVHPAARYDRVAYDRLIDDLIASALPEAAVSLHEPAAPIFICGMFRSGSTLCERLLARHSRVTPGGELATIPALIGERLQPYPASLAELNVERLDELRQLYAREVTTRFPAAARLTDKRCDNFLHIGLIKALFPAARIVHTRRHALDNIVSILFLYFDDNIAYGFSIDDVVHYYKGYRRLMAHWRTLYGADIFDFDYDAVVRDPGPTMRALLDFCALEPEAACLAGEAAEGSVRTASAWQVRQPLHSKSSERWRNYAAPLAEAIKALDGY